jgi:hypothetical protein
MSWSAYHCWRSSAGDGMPAIAQNWSSVRMRMRPGCRSLMASARRMLRLVRLRVGGVPIGRGRGRRADDQHRRLAAHVVDGQPAEAGDQVARLPPAQ